MRADNASAALAALSAVFADGELLPEVPERHLHDWLIAADAQEQPLALVRPRTTQQVSAAVAVCHRHGIPIVPQGGLTGLTGGATPVRGALLVSLERMTGIEPVDAVAQTVVVEAGAPLQRVQEAADAAGLLFPLDIGARGSCTIGGNLATNAGGNRVLRYGMARDLVLGLEAVLADGTVVSSMNRMLKNNAGYDLKQLFIGTEGTLGIITRAVLRLSAKPRSVAVALAACADFGQLERFLMLSRAALGSSLSAFEVMWPEFYSRAAALVRGQPPLAPGAGIVALLELSSFARDAQADMIAFLDQALHAGLVEDATVAQSLGQVEQIWAIRDSAGEIARSFTPVGNFDVSVPSSRMGELVTACRARLLARWPHMVPVFFGHIVDGNLHIIAGNLPERDLHALEETVYGCVRDLGGSISAEHGIGLQKRGFLSWSRTTAEIELMRQLKAALDPKNVLNPGKVFSVPTR